MEVKVNKDDNEEDNEDEDDDINPRRTMINYQVSYHFRITSSRQYE